MASSKTDTEVIIGGKMFTLSGYESEEYLQKVASYINNKINEYSKIDSFRRQPADTQISSLEDELQAKDQDLYNLKHELIAAQIKLDTVEEQVKALQKARSEGEKEIVRLETELKKK